MVNSKNNDLQNTTQKTKDRAARTRLKSGSELICFEWVSISCSTIGIRRVTLVINLVVSHERGKDRFICRLSSM